MNTSDFKKKHNDFLNNDCVKKINFSLLIDGLYTKFLTILIKNKYTKKKINKFTKCYFDTYTNEDNRSFPRESLIPFTKWYVKKYHKKYNIDIIMTAIMTYNVEKLNKNLKKHAKEFLELYSLNT